MESQQSITLKELIAEIISDADLHAKWINTLSMMENTGARKIAAFEDKVHVNETILKHAAEEFRHAYYLKRQLFKIVPMDFGTYEPHNLLAPIASHQYLHALDIEVSRYLKKELKLEGSKFKYMAYLITTYCIEQRADQIYPIYQDLLKAVNSPVSVRSIIIEEEGHLEDMTRMLEEELEDWKVHTEACMNIENRIFDNWLEKVEVAIGSTLA